MTHDFDKAIDRYTASLDAMCRFHTEDDYAILFALRFTKAALSGVITIGMHEEGQRRNSPSNAFRTMTAQLAKEVEGG